MLNRLLAASTSIVNMSLLLLAMLVNLLFKVLSSW